MMVKKPGLGRGLDMLLSSAVKDDAANKDSELKKLPVEKIRKGEYQPRLSIDPDALQELAESIKAQGLVQPIVVRRIDGGEYELIAGERRWRASQIAGMHTIPAIIRDIPDQAAAAMSLIENIQREDLNPLEEAIAMSRLIADFGLTHQQTAESVGRSRAAVSNLLRLLDLEETTKELLDSGKLDMGHARALLALSGTKQVETAHIVARKELSVRETEKLVKKIANPDLAADKKTPVKKALEVQKLEESLSQTLGAQVAIQYNNKGKGKLVVEYNNLDELDGILEHIK
ncbi:ParB/RepB/Spo0J family partition protein [uncultured Cocleimonas sp.]|uniref:ParB/RepB/Spo0J family partition protein n=1 Tax=uncultured Cocleimonas sp. TaxID=1051587 RepID=UPI002610B875|nr:ParB/RepB/Spo0J family partition protein [uncultured Cocleimonas sp.]